MIRYFLIPVLIAFCGTPVISQDKEYIYDHYNISNGLISDNVYKIFMDGTGYTWILTYNGLQKYNGYEFETYTSKPGTTGSLSNNFVVDIFEDREGDMIIVLDDGIDIYHKQTGRFVNLLSHLPFAEFKRNEISRQASVAQDKTGSIWTTCHNRLVRIGHSKEDFFVYPDEFMGNFTLNADSSALLIITENTLKRYDLGTKTIAATPLADIPSPVSVSGLNAIFCDSRGICWVGTSGGLLTYDEKSSRFLEPRLVFPSNSIFSRRPFREKITAIYEDYNSAIWVASGNTLFRIDRETGDVKILRHELENRNSILDEQITGIYGNKYGTIWVTYLNEGFTSININTQNFRSYRFRAGNDHSLGGRTVRSVFRDSRGYIWAGLYNDGLDRIDPQTGSIRHFKNDPGSENTVCSNYISSLFIDSRGRIWVGSHDNGLCYADNAFGDRLKFRRPPFLNSNDEIYHILGDRLGRIWFGTRSGLGMFDYASGSFQWILKAYNVQSFVFDENTVWIASWNYGLCRLDFNADQFGSACPEFDTITSVNFRVKHPFGSVPAKTAAEGIQNCISIFQDGSSNVWLGTYDKGLAKATIKGQECSYEFYDESRGAPGNAVYGVLGDEEGNIWISTEHGIGKFDPVSEYFENYTREDGLLSDYFMWKAYHRSADGEMIFGSVDGLNLFYPGEIHKDTLPSRVLISELKIQNQAVNYGDTVNGEVVLHKHITCQDTLILNYRNNTLSFEFFAPGRFNPGKIRYEHTLAGYDDGWIAHDKGNRVAGYNKLPPGTYYFRVRQADTNGKTKNGYSEKKIILLPPWWKTKLAYTAYLMIIASLLFLITHSLYRFLKLKHELIYNEKLHQSRMMFFTNISHEFKTPLSLILAPLTEVLSGSQISIQVRRNLRMAMQNAEGLYGLINELLEFRRTEAGISRLRPEQIELTSFVTLAARQFEYVAEQKKIAFFINIPEERLNVWVDRQKFSKIINNLIENALKYTRSGRPHHHSTGP